MVCLVLLAVSFPLVKGRVVTSLVGSLYFIDSTAMPSHCLLYHGEASQKNDWLPGLQDPYTTCGVSPVGLSRHAAISRRLCHHQLKRQNTLA